MKIKEVCERTGLTDRAIRYYIENGLVFPEKNENYAGRRNFSFSERDMELLMQIKVLRNAGFSIEQIKRLQTNASVQEIVSERICALEIEKENNDAILTVLSKIEKKDDFTWEQLVVALENPESVSTMTTKDEIAPLGYLFRRLKKIVVALSVCLFVFLLSASVLFFAFVGPQWIQRRAQSGVAMVMVRENGTFLTTEQFVMDDAFSATDGGNGYTFAIDYGEIRGKVFLYNDTEIEFGLINTNNWHMLNIIIDVEQADHYVHIQQTVTYKTDDERIVTMEASQTVPENTGFVSVFHDGV